MSKKYKIILKAIGVLVICIAGLSITSILNKKPEYRAMTNEIIQKTENTKSFDELEAKYPRTSLEILLQKGMNIESLNKVLEIECIKKINERKYYTIHKGNDGSAGVAVWINEKDTLVCSDSKVFYKKMSKNELLNLIDEEASRDYFIKNIEGYYTEPGPTLIATLHSHHYTSDGYCIYICYTDYVDNSILSIVPISVVIEKKNYKQKEDKIMKNLTKDDLSLLNDSVNCYSDSVKKITEEMHKGLYFVFDVYELSGKTEFIVTPYMKKINNIICLCNNEKKFDELITEKYPKDLLLLNNKNRKQRAGKFSNFISDINSKTKIECLRKTFEETFDSAYYSIMESEDKGLLVITYRMHNWDGDCGTRARPIDATDVWYIEKTVYSKDYEQFEANKSTMKDVQEFDKYGAYYLRNLNTASTEHYTKDGYYLKIQYKCTGGDIYDHSNYIVDEIDIRDLKQDEDYIQNNALILNKKDYEALTKGVANLSDVESIDKDAVPEIDNENWGETVHNTLDGYKVYIKYEYKGGNIKDYNNYIVNKKEIEEGTEYDACSLLDLDVESIKNYFSDR